MIKITFMGAGSTVFARNVLGDCMCTPALRESEIALYDIDEKRLEDSRIILSAINHNVNEDRAVIKTYLGAENRKDALRDADFVVNAIQVGGYEPCTVTDFEIPKKIRHQTDYRRYPGNWWYHACTSYHSGSGRVRTGYGRGLPEHSVPELLQPYGNAHRLYAAFHKDPHRRSLPQRSGLLPETS